VRPDERKTYFQAGSLQMLCHAFGVLFLLNDRPDLAAELDLDGAHVGQDDMPVAEARLLLGADRILGLSTHDAGEVEAARRADVDYVGLGPCFATDTKTLVRAPRGADLVAECRAAAGDLPVFPIGGITPDNVTALVAAGAARAAVGAGILAADDPAAAARTLRERLLGQ
jgi:thiamine-phosphate pyrophosphorylase